MSAVIGRAGSWPRRWGFLLAAVGIATAATPLLAAIPHITDPDALPPSTPALVGFSFSPIAAIALGEDPLSSLQQLLHELHPDLVRLPANWREMGAQQGSLDFTGLDQLLATVSGYNRQEHAHARVVMVVGARNLSYPEVYVPDRMSADKRLPLPQLERSPDYRQYLSETFRRYAASSLLYAWQLENEPLDKVTTDTAGNPALNAGALTRELKLLRSIDRRHPAIVTSFNSSHVDLDRRAVSPLGWLYQFLPGPKPSGHPEQALQIGDVLGLDIYVVTPTTPLSEEDAAIRIDWKADALGYWSTVATNAGKELWITEMQASPWVDSPSFSTRDLLTSARAYRGNGASVVLLWGVESWLQSPGWMKAGKEAVDLLREPLGS